MTIDKAIKQLTNLSVHNATWYQPGCFNALRLGIEALMRIKATRGVGSVIISPLLPGETLQ